MVNKTPARFNMRIEGDFAKWLQALMDKTGLEAPSVVRLLVKKEYDEIQKEGGKKK